LKRFALLSKIWLTDHWFK